MLNKTAMESLSDRLTHVGNKSSGLKDKVEELSLTTEVNDQFIKRDEQNMGSLETPRKDRTLRL